MAITVRHVKERLQAGRFAAREQTPVCLVEKCRPFHVWRELSNNQANAPAAQRQVLAMKP
jgi:hypothetical protein